MDLKKARNFFPPLILDRIKTTTIAKRYLTKNDELLIQSDTHRKQSDNKLDCFRKLHGVIVNAAALPGETSDEQKDRVVKLYIYPTLYGNPHADIHS